MGSKYLIVLIIFIFAGIHNISRFHKNEHKAEKLFVPPVKHMKLYSFGYDSMLASLMWIRVLQDINVCDQKHKVIAYPQFTESDDPLAQVLNRQLPPARCTNGWVYQMLDVITHLDNQFESAYKDGATFLSVVVDDREGAQKIFNKGLIWFPDDWELLYRAAYHELFEMQNPNTSAVLMRKAGERGAPQWVYALSAKLYSKLGQAAFAKTILESVLARKQEGPDMDRVRAQLEKINKILENPTAQ